MAKKKGKQNKIPQRLRPPAKEQVTEQETFNCEPERKMAALGRIQVWEREWNSRLILEGVLHTLAGAKSAQSRVLDELLFFSLSPDPRIC